MKANAIKAFNPRAHAANSMLEPRAVGIFVVSVGELEAFDRRSGGHGPTWVNDVLQRDLEKDTYLTDARDFAKAIMF